MRIFQHYCLVVVVVLQIAAGSAVCVGRNIHKTNILFYFLKLFYPNNSNSSRLMKLQKKIYK